MADHVVLGKLVRVTDRIEAGRLGAVMISVRGGTEEFYARAPAGIELSPGQMVQVVGYSPPRTVDIEPVLDAQAAVDA